jgi:hypothetical protein
MQATDPTLARAAARTRDGRPAVSVIVPCYNGGQFLDQLTACLARQTFRNFETIVIDDGSTDSATQAKLASLGPDIRVVHQENRGLSAARNTGFLEARAELVMILDCDDQLEPTYLQETFDVLESAPAEVGFAFTYGRMVGALHGIDRKYFNEFDELFKNVLGYSMLIRKAAWRKAGGYDVNMCDGYEDWEFNIRLIAAGYRGIAIQKPLFVYNVSMHGMFMSHSSRMHGELWRRIRKKHSDLYRLSHLVRLFLKTRAAPSDVSLLRIVASLMLTSILPDSWYGVLMHFVRRFRLWRLNVFNAARLPSHPVGS